jgi:valyl-tRNA synthetase
MYIHGLVKDAQEQKMSKSRQYAGPVIDRRHRARPLLDKRSQDLRKPETAPQASRLKEFQAGILGYGADALRFTFSIRSCSCISTLTANAARLPQLCNKLATRLC